MGRELQPQYQASQCAQNGAESGYERLLHGAAAASFVVEITFYYIHSNSKTGYFDHGFLRGYISERHINVSERGPESASANASGSFAGNVSRFRC